MHRPPGRHIINRFSDSSLKAFIICQQAFLSSSAHRHEHIDTNIDLSPRQIGHIVVDIIGSEASSRHSVNIVNILNRQTYKVPSINIVGPKESISPVTSWLRATGCEQGLNDPNTRKREDRVVIELTLDRQVGGSRKRAGQGSGFASKVRKTKA